MNVGPWRTIPYCLVLCAATAALVPITTAHATHFRYGHVQWSQGASENEVNFVIQNAWRMDQGPCIDPATGGITPCTGPDGLPGVGDIHRQGVSSPSFQFGDGNTFFTSGGILHLVTDIDPENNWYFGTVVDHREFPNVVPSVKHTYDTPGQYTAYFQDCCRIAQSFPNHHVNNPQGTPGQNTLVETVVNVGEDNNNSPIALIDPIVLCTVDQVCTFTIAASDPDGDDLQFRFSEPVEATGGSTFHQPGPPHASNAAMIDQSTGVYTWDTTGAVPDGVDPAEWNVLYSTQVTIEDLDENGNVKSKVAVDFFIQLVPETDGTPPECAITPSGPLTIVPGQEVEINVVALDPDNDAVTLNSLGLPGGAIAEPALPISGEGVVSATVTWMPTADQLGNNLIRFTATDADGQGTCDMIVTVLDRELWLPMKSGVTGTIQSIATFGESEPSDSNCCTDHGAPGCDDPDCANLVCSEDPFCCEVSWDSTCASIAQSVCNACEHAGPDDIFVAGTINAADGQSVNHIARWDGEQWNDVGGGIDGPFPLVNDMIVWNDHLYITGSFTTAGGITVNNIAKWDGEQWSALGSGLSGTGWALAVYNDELYAGGAFSQAGGITANQIARWNGSSWSPVGGGVSGGLARVYAMHVHEGALYVGGRFTHAGNISANNIARWNGSWSSLAQGVGSSVRAIANYDDGMLESGELSEALYVGGTFTEAGGNPAGHLARWDGLQWSAVAGGVSGLDENTAVLSLKTHNDGQGESLFVGGAFTEAGEESAQYLARWDGFSWHPYGVGMSNAVTSLGIGHDGEAQRVVAGGAFTSIGGVDANGVVQWVGHAFKQFPTNATCDASQVITDGQYEFDTTFATTDGLPEPAICDGNGDSQIHADLWYQYTATCDGFMTAELCGSSFNTKLGVYTGHCNIESGSMLACDVASCGGQQARITLPVNEGQTFKLRVGGHLSDTGPGVLNVQCEPGVIGDLNGDGVVDVLDMLILMGAWGTCPEYCPADLNNDGIVDVFDLLILISNWG